MIENEVGLSCVYLQTPMPSIQVRDDSSESRFTQKFLHRGAFKQTSFYTQTPLHTEACTHRGCYTQKPLHRKLLHIEALTPTHLLQVVPHKAVAEVSKIGNL